MPNPQPNPATPQPMFPPGAPPIEVNPGEIHEHPEVDFGNEPVQPMEPHPDTPPAPGPEREQPYEPDTEPGKE